MNEKKKPAILVSGSLAFDIIFSIPIDFRKSIPLNRGKIRSFNASYIAEEKKEFPGGNAGNIAFWLGHEGIPSFIFSAWGKDFAEKKYREKLESLGVVIRGTECGHTAHAYMISDPLHQQLIIWQPNAFKHHDTQLLTDYFTEDELKAFSYAIFSVGSPESLQNHIRTFRKQNKKALVIFDPGQVTPLFSKKAFHECCSCSDIVIGNDIEFEHFRKFTVPKGLIEIETRGKKGVLLRQYGKEKAFPSVKVQKVVETTGAGDAFRAGLLAGLSKGKTLDESVVLGTKLGAKCVGYPSGQY